MQNVTCKGEKFQLFISLFSLINRIVIVIDMEKMEKQPGGQFNQSCTVIVISFKTLLGKRLIRTVFDTLIFY